MNNRLIAPTRISSLPAELRCAALVGLLQGAGRSPQGFGNLVDEVTGVPDARAQLVEAIGVGVGGLALPLRLQLVEQGVILTMASFTLLYSVSYSPARARIWSGVILICLPFCIPFCNAPTGRAQ